MHQRQQFINQLFNEIKSIDYTLLKFIEGSIDRIDPNSDLDILMDKEVLPFINSIIRNCDEVENVDVLNLESMNQFFIYFKDGSFLQIDCLFQLIRKNMVYLSNDYVQENSITIEGIKTYNNKCLFEHLMMFHQLNKDGLPEKYFNYFAEIPIKERLEIIQHFNERYNTDITFSRLKNHDPFLRQHLVKHLNRQTFNAAPHKQLNTFNYLKETIAKFWNGRGKVITFSGVDGAGKSTILAETKQMLEKKFRKKVVVLRHRPSILPILSAMKHGKKGAEKRAAEKMPRQGTNKSSLSSSLRFAYYYLDYFFGQWYIFFRYQMFNYIVLYDRYYFDFIVDGKRSNIQMDSRITKRLYRFVHKPKLNFFLYASPQVILARKKELTASDIESLTANYQNLFSNLSDQYDQKYLPIKNIDKANTLQYIQKEIKAIL